MLFSNFSFPTPETALATRPSAMSSSRRYAEACILNISDEYLATELGESHYQGRQLAAMAFDQAENAIAGSPSTNTPASIP